MQNPISPTSHKAGIGAKQRSSMYIKAIEHSNSILTAPQPPQSYRPEHNYIRRSPVGTSSSYLGESLYEDDMRKISLIRGIDQLVINKAKVLQVSYGDLSIIKRESFLCNPSDPSIAHYTLVLHRLSCIDRRTFDNKFYELDQISRNTNHPNILRIFSFWSEDPPDAYSYKSLVVLQEYSPFTMREYISSYLTTNHLSHIPEPLLIRIGCDLSSALATLHQSNVSHCGLREYNVYVRVDEDLFEASDLETPDPSMVSFCLALPWRAELDVLCTPAPDTLGTSVRTPMSQMLSATLVKKAPDTIYIEKETELRNGRASSNKTTRFGGVRTSGSSRDTNSSRGSSLSDGTALPSLSALGDYFGLDLYSLGITLAKVLEIFGCSDIQQLQAPTDLGPENKEYIEVLKKTYPNTMASLTLLLNIYDEELGPDFVVSANHVHALFATYFAVVIQRNFRASLVKRDRKLIVASATMIQCEYRRYLYSKRFRTYRRHVLCTTAHSLQAMIKALPQRLYFEKVLKATIRIEALARRVLASQEYQDQRSAALLVQKTFRGTQTRRAVVTWKQQLQARKQQMESLGTVITAADTDTVTANPFYPEERKEEDALYPASFARYQSVGSFLRANSEKFTFIGSADRNAKRLEELTKVNRVLETENKQMKSIIEKRDAELKAREDAIGLFGDEYSKAERQLRANYERLNAACQHCANIPLRVEPVTYTAWERLHDTQNVVENVLRDDDSLFTRKDACIKLSFDPSIVTRIRIHPGEPGPLRLELALRDTDEKLIFAGSYTLGRIATEINLVAADAVHATLAFRDNIRGGSICSVRFVEIIGVSMPNTI